MFEFQQLPTEINVMIHEFKCKMEHEDRVDHQNKMKDVFKFMRIFTIDITENMNMISDLHSWGMPISARYLDNCRINYRKQSGYSWRIVRWEIKRTIDDEVNLNRKYKANFVKVMDQIINTKYNKTDKHNTKIYEFQQLPAEVNYMIDSFLTESYLNDHKMKYDMVLFELNERMKHIRNELDKYQFQNIPETIHYLRTSQNKYSLQLFVRFQFKHYTYEQTKRLEDHFRIGYSGGYSRKEWIKLFRERKIDISYDRIHNFINKNYYGF